MFVYMSLVFFSIVVSFKSGLETLRQTEKGALQTSFRWGSNTTRKLLGIYEEGFFHEVFLLIEFW
jgi:hypothetical protein